MSLRIYYTVNVKPKRTSFTLSSTYYLLKYMYVLRKCRDTTHSLRNYLQYHIIINRFGVVAGQFSSLTACFTNIFGIYIPNISFLQSSPFFIFLRHLTTSVFLTYYAFFSCHVSLNMDFSNF